MSAVARRVIGATAVALVVGGTSFAAGAATSSSNGPTYYACVKSGNTLALTTRGKACPKHERKISFNAKGVRGARGAKGIPGGASLVDGNQQVLGSVISASPTQVEIVTSKGFQVTIGWADGQPVQDEDDPIYNANATCTSTPYLLAPGTDPNTTVNPKEQISGTALFYTHENNQLYEPVATTTSHTAVTEIVTPRAVYNLGACSAFSAGTYVVWKLAPISHAAAGLPDTITVPLTLH